MLTLGGAGLTYYVLSPTQTPSRGEEEGKAKQKGKKGGALARQAVRFSTDCHVLPDFCTEFIHSKDLVHWATPPCSCHARS
jgi:hypothetical protein